MKELNDERNIQNWIKNEGISWKFQPLRAPHFGGAHEGLVRQTKLTLYRALDAEKRRNRYPCEEVLRILFAETSSLLNSRPLGYASSDPKDAGPQAPNDLLNRPSGYLGVPLITSADANPTKRYKYVQYMTDVFWDIWKRRYLQSLVTRSEWKNKQRNLQIGDLVLLTEPNLPRREWITGKVIETFPGKDNLVRVAMVRTSSGEFTRAVHQLCLLEEINFKTSLNDPESLVSGEDRTLYGLRFAQAGLI